MKSVFRSILIMTLACLCTLSLVSCGKGIKSDDAKALINDFFDAIVAEDYEKAESYLHPDCPAELESFFLNAEKELDIDFQEGIEIEKYTGVSSSIYDSTVDGSAFELTMRTKVGDTEVIFTIEIAKNDSGYGICNLELGT